jgi:hypothetical protein
MILDLEPDSDVQWRMFNAQLRTQIRGGEKWVPIVEQCALAGLACWMYYYEPVQERSS